MRTIIVFALALLMSIPLSAQKDETLLNNPRLKLTGIWGGPISRVHDFSGEGKFAGGGFFAFELNKNFLIGWDGYDIRINNDDDKDINSNTSGLMLGYMHDGYKVVHPVANISIGRAQTKRQYQSSINSFAAHASIGAEFNIFRWFRIGGELGYRYIDHKNIEWMEEAKLSSPYAGIKMKFGWSWDN